MLHAVLDIIINQINIYIMKRLLHNLFCAVAFTITATVVSATTYCQYELTNGDKTVLFSAEKIGDDLYQVTIEGEGLTGFGGTFCNANGTGGYDIRTNLVVSDDNKKMVATIASTTEPTFYTPLYVLMPGEVNFGEIKDIEWGTCGAVEADTEAPVMGTATLESTTHNSAVITVSATDNITNPVTRFEVTDEAHSFSKTIVATDNKISVNSLTPNTEYDFTIKAIDNYGNISANSTNIVATTTTKESETSGSRIHFDGVVGTPISFTIEYKEKNVSITLVSNESEKPIDYVHAMINGAGTPSFAINEGTATYTVENVEENSVLAIAFIYSTTDSEGNWQTAQAFDESDPNIIYYIAKGNGEMTAIDNIDMTNINIYSTAGNIVINGANNAVCVYNITGQQIAYIAQPNDMEVISLRKGLYIVKCGTHTAKVNVK